MPPCRRCGERCPSQREFISDGSIEDELEIEEFTTRYWTLCSGCDSALDEDGKMQAYWREHGLWSGEMNSELVEFNWRDR